MISLSSKLYRSAVKALSICSQSSIDLSLINRSLPASNRKSVISVRLPANLPRISKAAAVERGRGRAGNVCLQAENARALLESAAKCARNNTHTHTAFPDATAIQRATVANDNSERRSTSKVNHVAIRWFARARHCIACSQSIRARATDS